MKKSLLNYVLIEGALILRQNFATQSKSNIVFEHTELITFAQRAFQAQKINIEDSKLMAEHLVLADLRSQEGHGVSRIPIYINRLKVGVVNSCPRISIDKKSESVQIINGDNGMGFVVASLGMKQSIDMAESQGIGLVGINNSNHFGASAGYILQALEENLISIILTNSSPAQPPWGSTNPLLGASPIAAGAPSGSHFPFLLDMATSAVSRGKLRLAHQRGESIPPGVALDKNGLPTTDGMEAFHGTILNFGGVKGYGIVLLTEILAGVFTGANFGGKVTNLYKDFVNKQNVGHLIITIKPDLFMTLDAFKQRMDALIEIIKSQPLADGFNEILIPGEPEYRSYQKRIKEGIPLQRSTVESLLEIAHEYDISFPVGVPESAGGSDDRHHVCSPNCRHH